MKALQLRTIDKLYFGHEDIARALNISLNSAKVTATRYVRVGILVRLKRNMYMLQEKWTTLTTAQKFAIANAIQTPSYISLTTALDFYEITTQMQQNFIESIVLKRTRTVKVCDTIFNYVKINPDLYFGFMRKQGFFIAEPEKAFLDALYLMSLGRYRLDIAAIDLGKFDRDKINEFSRKFPPTTQKLLLNYEIA